MIHPETKEKVIKVQIVQKNKDFDTKEERFINEEKDDKEETPLIKESKKPDENETNRN